MKKTFLITILGLFVAAMAFAQSRTLPSASVKTLYGQSLNAADLGTSGKITVIIFWATWCKTCKDELDALKDNYGDWQENYGLNIIALSVDDARTAAKIPLEIEEKGWEYRVLIDSYKELQVALNLASVPYTILIDANGSIVYEHVGFEPGFEAELEDQVKLVAKK